MVNTDLLRGKFAENGLKQYEVAKAIGLNKCVFSRKMKRKVFGSDEIEKMIFLLNITDPMPIFFDKNVT